MSQCSLTSIARESLSEPSSGRVRGLEHTDKLNILGRKWNYLDPKGNPDLLRFYEKKEDSSEVLVKLVAFQG